MYREVRGPVEEEFIQPPKVHIGHVCVFMKNLDVDFSFCDYHTNVFLAGQ